MMQYQVPEDFFSPLEYVICDTAYEPTSFCVPAFKCVSGDGPSCTLIRHFSTQYWPNHVFGRNTLWVYGKANAHD